MGIFKLITYGLIIWLVIWFVKRSPLLNKKADKTKPISLSAKMIRCDECGIHVPESEIVLKNGKNLCSSHANAFPNKNKE